MYLESPMLPAGQTEEVALDQFVHPQLTRLWGSVAVNQMMMADDECMRGTQTCFNTVFDDGKLTPSLSLLLSPSVMSMMLEAGAGSPG